MNKQKLKKFQYNIHLELATFWGNMWLVIEKDINDKSELEMQNKYKTLHNKLKKLSEKQVQTNASKENTQQDAVTQDAGHGLWFSTSYANLRQTHIFEHQM
jgi:glycine betaine/choline ABC-type transport system substrate-binding protein